MRTDPPPDREPDTGRDLLACCRRVRELEARLEESEETLDAIRRGTIDAVVVGMTAAEHRVYTLEDADRPYRVLIEQIQEGAVTLSADGTVFYCNRRLAEMLGMPQEQVIGRRLQPFLHPRDVDAFERLLAAAHRGRAPGEFTILNRSGVQIPAYVSLSLLRRDEGEPLVCGVVADLTQQKLHLDELSDANARLETESKERAKAEEALRQAQKMEAVGQLTGGLAHDFNNLLTGISGSLEILRARVAQGRIGDLDRYLITAQGAASRAAALTHRLLAFSRRQTLDPRTVHANELIAGMEDLLRRTAGPAIEMETVLLAGLWPTLCDPNQLENALLNLAINARDAMPDGGRLTIETANTWVDERAARERDMAPGQYVAVCVTDTGTGMAPDVVERAFDPFFTTKPIGMGTGLGLSMIYGFAKQSDGQIRIETELGKGTTMRLYLPRHRGATEPEQADGDLVEAPRAGSGETVLVIDDEPTIRMLIAEVLKELGYAAIEASDGSSGLKLLRSDVRIDLLITDVGLPGGMNGRQVADAARQIRPGLKVLFITGYAENAAVGSGHLERGMQVLTKPFAMESLASRIKAIITGA